VLSNGHAGFGGRPEETGRSKDRHRASGRPNLAEGKTPMESMRALKRRLSDVVHRQMTQDATTAPATGPRGQRGATLQSSAADLNPQVNTSEQSLPGPAEAKPRTPVDAHS
jgi:hypothetical protein